MLRVEKLKAHWCNHYAPNPRKLRQSGMEAFACTPHLSEAHPPFPILTISSSFNKQWSNSVFYRAVKQLWSFVHWAIYTTCNNTGNQAEENKRFIAKTPLTANDYYSPWRVIDKAHGKDSDKEGCKSCREDKITCSENLLDRLSYCRLYMKFPQNVLTCQSFCANNCVTRWNVFRETATQYRFP